MSNKSIMITPSVELSYPISMNNNLVNGLVNFVPDVVSILAIKGIQTAFVIVKEVRNGFLQLEFHAQESAYIRKYVIPNNAMYSAIQKGRNQIYRMNLDPDLRERALRQLERNLEQWEISRY